MKSAKKWFKAFNLIISILNAFEAYINRKKMYYYRVDIKYIPKKLNGNTISINLSVYRDAPIWSNHEVLSNMELNEVLYPKHKKHLDNGTIEVIGVVYLGSKYN